METQTKSRKYEGQCKFCGRDFTKRMITKHLDDCQKRKRDENVNDLRLKISDPYTKNFWLVVEVNHQAKLKDLDSLIRDVWVECCGHLSQFGGYGDEIGKGRIIMDTLRLGDSTTYIYDFGSSTELVIETLGYSHYPLAGRGKVELVARNYLPLANCRKCGRPATMICSTCVDREGEMQVCDECAVKYHNEDRQDEEHYLLPLANSPRAGVCGYEPPGRPDELF